MRQAHIIYLSTRPSSSPRKPHERLTLTALAQHCHVPAQVAPPAPDYVSVVPDLRPAKEFVVPVSGFRSIRLSSGIGIAAAGLFALGTAVAVRAEGDAASAKAAGSAERLASRAFFAGYTRPASTPYPADNAYTPAREALGRALFFDPRLSGSGWISCASCHNPGLSWGDGLPRAIGHGMQVLGRRTPTILNLAWGDAFFWDGRAGSLEEQALGPIQAAGEMNLDLETMIARLRAVDAYRPLFDAAYPGEGIQPATVAKAIATFERGVVSADAPFDRWVGGDEDAIGVEAKKGFVLFNTKAACSKCHGGWRFTDDSFHDIGVRGDDLGRGALLKEIPSLRHAFKTPTLRDADRRGPYMHDGSVPTLEAVVDFYDTGGAVARESLSNDMKPLGLTADEKRQLVAFMRTLTSPGRAVEMPVLPR
jgi:cytochrome c peroxidase